MSAVKLTVGDGDDPLASETYQLLQVEVSPKMALEWLESRAPNRPIRQRRVEMYAHDMKHGHWRVNGETIKFDKFGRLIDGQHRLWAIAEADVAVDLTLALGLEPEVMATVDTGAPRAFSDVLAINGGANTRAVAAIARLIWNYERGVYASGGSAAPSHTDLAALLSRFDDLPLYVSEHKARLNKIGFQTPIMFVTYLGKRLDAVKSDVFLERLTTGANLEPTEAIYHLRERLVSMKGQSGHGGKTAQDVLIGTIIKGWNYFLAGRQMQLLRYVPNQEGFLAFDPKIPGLKTPAPERVLRDKVKTKGVS